ncbi:MAG: hypothetical protein U1E05_03830, partial [Patescibacteria group bacterium]|nr:hypothetical protein [Patescibacteria group bacterium]
ATITAKEGVFSTTEEQSVLKGLDRQHQYVKTPLWHRGIPLVHEYPFAIGQERYYLQMPSGTWVGIADYDALAEIAADHYLVKKKNPDAQTLWRIFNDPEEREKLRFLTEMELEFRQAREDFGLPYGQFSETKERIRSWHKALGLPLDYAVLNHLIRIEAANPGGVERALRARVPRAYPGFAEYLAAAGEDPQSLDMSVLIERFTKYRSGDRPSGGPVALGPHLMASIPADLPAGWRQLIAPNRAPDPKLTGVPQHKPHPGSSVEWWQWFTITNEPGKGDPQFVSVSVGLEPQFYTWTTAAGKTYQGDRRTSLEGMATNKAINCRWMDDNKTSVLYVVNDSHVEINFVRAGVYANVRATFPKSPRTPYTQADCEALARHFARVVAGKIDAGNK